ncbi:MAG: DUF4435 domain-containing protein [Alistipes sp.]|nr:DUF4435 domain-containing protein [Alistipes sp.]
MVSDINSKKIGKTDSNEPLPQPLPYLGTKRLVKVYVEGYEDVAFWRCIFDHFRNPYLRFEISVPTRPDLPKGKKVLMSMIPTSSEEKLLCVDSDFDYLFGERTEQSRTVNNSRYMFHTYAYATENFLCYAPSLHNICVKATKNDTRIFDFVKFMEEYSLIIYPVFLWYAYSAQMGTESIFTLNDFRSTVRLGYLDIKENGRSTLEWLRGNVSSRLRALERNYPQMQQPVEDFGRYLRDSKDVVPEQTYLYMHGHTLMDNVVMVLLTDVCDHLRKLSQARISSSSKEGIALRDEMSNYNNSLRSIRDVLLDNENYTSCPLYKRLSLDIEHYLQHTISQMQRNCE